MKKTKNNQPPTLDMDFFMTQGAIGYQKGMGSKTGEERSEILKKAWKTRKKNARRKKMAKKSGDNSTI